MNYDLPVIVVEVLVGHLLPRAIAHLANTRAEAVVRCYEFVASAPILHVWSSGARGDSALARLDMTRTDSSCDSPLIPFRQVVCARSPIVYKPARFLLCTIGLS